MTNIKKQIPVAVVTAPPHLAYLTRLKRSVNTPEGKSIEIWRLAVPSNGAGLTEWASSFRQQYCPDQEIDALRAGTGLSRAEYLEQLVFPDRLTSPGPSIRSGDFAELLISDFVEFVKGYWVPRGKYAEKATRNESVKGVDILGFRLTHLKGPPTQTDTLIAFEVKGECSDTPYSGGLQKAIDDSAKDYLRRAYTLNATKRRLLRAGEQESALIVERFQNLSDNPYDYRSGAAAVLSDTAYDAALIRAATNCSLHTNASKLELVVIRGKDLMRLVHHLYDLAANEA